MANDEHYISRALLRRFTIDGHFQRYQVDTNRWNRRSPSNVFFHSGYNQLIVEGQVDDTLERAFSKVETLLPRTLHALDEAVTVPSTVFPEDLYCHMCQYCAFSKNVSIFAKASAPVSFVIQVNAELKDGRSDTLRDVLKFPEDIIKQFQEEYARGKRVIIHSKDSLQLVYRIQFRHGYPTDYKTFRGFTAWSVWESPIPLPLSDVALIAFPVEAQNAIVYLLPVSPRLLLKGILKTGEQPSSLQSAVQGGRLTVEQAQLCHDIICASALKELISPHRIDDIKEARRRGSREIRVPSVINLQGVLSAGTTNVTAALGLALVPPEDYRAFAYSHVRPSA